MFSEKEEEENLAGKHFDYYTVSLQFVNMASNAASNFDHNLKIHINRLINVPRQKSVNHDQYKYNR